MKNLLLKTLFAGAAIIGWAAIFVIYCLVNLLAFKLIDLHIDPNNYTNFVSLFAGSAVFWGFICFEYLQLMIAALPKRPVSYVAIVITGILQFLFVLRTYMTYDLQDFWLIYLLILLSPIGIAAQIINSTLQNAADRSRV